MKLTKQQNSNIQNSLCWWSKVYVCKWALIMKRGTMHLQNNIQLFTTIHDWNCALSNSTADLCLSVSAWMCYPTLACLSCQLACPNRQLACPNSQLACLTCFAVLLAPPDLVCDGGTRQQECVLRWAHVQAVHDRQAHTGWVHVLWGGTPICYATCFHWGGYTH